MRTVALRFAESFAPECGTVAAHQEPINANGHVRHGKLGSAVSTKTAGEILDGDDPEFFIHSGGQDRWGLILKRFSERLLHWKKYPGIIAKVPKILVAGLRLSRLNVPLKTSCRNALLRRRNALCLQPRAIA